MQNTHKKLFLIFFLLLFSCPFVLAVNETNTSNIELDANGLLEKAEDTSNKYLGVNGWTIVLYALGLLLVFGVAKFFVGDLAYIVLLIAIVYVLKKVMG